MKIKHIFTNVYFLSLIPFIVILFFLPVNIKKYSLELIREDAVLPGYYIFYDDLNGDGTSEKITAFDQASSTGIFINGEEGVLDQWNFRGSLDFSLKKCLFIAGDRDDNGFKEIYVFTLSGDSIFLNCISDKLDAMPEFSGRFICVVGKGIKSPDPYIIPADMEDIDGDGTKELIFGIGTGFSYTPRNVFAYNIRTDKLIVSPESSYFVNYILQEDINNDGRREIIPHGYAASNIGPDKAKYHDHSSFFMVLDQKLKFLFDPLEFKGRYSILFPVVSWNDGKSSMAALYSPPSIKSSSILYEISQEGRIEDSTILGFHAGFLFPNKNEYLVQVDGEGYRLCDSHLKTLRKLPVSEPGACLTLDLDSDSDLEYLICFPGKRKISIFRKGLNNEVSLELPDPIASTDILTVRKGPQGPKVISIQTPKNWYMLEYGKNPLFYQSYLIYLLIYLFILGFSLLLRLISRNQLKKKYENEKKISELQMALLRNQLDPHFTLNAINTIIYSVNYGDKEMAADQLRCFSSLYRNLLLSAGSSQRSIDEEISFCENYLTLEKMRFGERFNYSVEISDDVDRGMLIPKFLIQIHAENAVKHGLEPLDSGGLLSIRIKKDKKELVVEVEDNGIGMQASVNEIRMSTGKGLGIMNEVYSIHNKIFREKISSEITDLFDAEGRPSGTKVLIRIQDNASVVRAD
jgi:hypothetical protein